MDHHLGIHSKTWDGFIFRMGFTIAAFIRPHPYKVGPNGNSRKGAVVKGLRENSQ